MRDDFLWARLTSYNLKKNYIYIYLCNLLILPRLIKNKFLIQYHRGLDP